MKTLSKQRLKMTKIVTQSYYECCTSVVKFSKGKQMGSSHTVARKISLDPNVFFNLILVEKYTLVCLWL